MAKYPEMTEEQREKVREYKRRYNKKNPEKVKEWRERYALKHLEGIKKAKLKSFFKFYNLYKNKEQMLRNNFVQFFTTFFQANFNNSAKTPPALYFTCQ